jgi:hypothetical protein
MDADSSVTATFAIPQRTLNVSVSGPGRVTGQGIDCPPTCQVQYANGTQVTLTAAPTIAGATHVWGGACSGTGATCTVTMNSDLSVTITFTAPRRTLTVTVNGPGKVTGSGIDCPPTCQAQYPNGTQVTLTAVPNAAGTTHVWGGACTGSGTTCTVTMNSDLSVTITFTAPPPQRTLTVAVTGPGKVTGPSIDCPPTCQAQYPNGTQVTLTAVPNAAGTTHVWGGACSGSGTTCTVTMNSDLSVTITFSGPATQRTLNVAVNGPGKVTGQGIDCPPTCQAQYANGTQLTLAATPATAGATTTWGGACSGTAVTCSLTMDADKTVSVTFVALTGVRVVDDPASEPGPKLPPPTAVVEVDVSGYGNVQTQRALAAAGQRQAQIRCGSRGATCYSQTDPNQKVRMRATPDDGYRFAGWSGACTGKNSVCTVTAQQTQQVGATFVPTRQRGATVAFSIRRARLVRLKWKASVANGTLLIRGSITQRARIRLSVMRPGGALLLKKTFTQRAATSFEHPESLQPRRLRRGVKLLPGGLIVRLSGRSVTGAGLPLQVRTLTVDAPREGVVKSTFVSRTRNGPKVKAKSLRFGATEAWVTFNLAAQPEISPITVTWLDPSKRPLEGSRTKNNRPTIKTGIGGAVIPRGDWTAQLRVAGQVIAQRLVRIR